MIAQKLRDMHALAADSCDPEFSRALIEAADEIERLRAALRPFADVPPDNPPEKRCIIMDAKAGPYHILQSDLDRAKAVLSNQQLSGEKL